MQCFILACAECLSLQTQHHLTTSECLRPFKLLCSGTSQKFSIKIIFNLGLNSLQSRQYLVGCGFFSFFLFFLFLSLSDTHDTENLQGQLVDYSIGPLSYYPREVESWGTQLLMSCLHINIYFMFVLVYTW